MNIKHFIKFKSISKMKQFILFFFFLATQLLWSQSSFQSFEHGNSAYRNGKLDEAINQYLLVEKAGFNSADLYFNMGNAFYKSNKIAPSIYYYEKALLLDQNHVDARNNLAFAQRMTIDVIEPMPKTFFQKINETIIYPISYNAWAWISVILAFVSAGFFIAYYFSDYSRNKRLFFVSTFVILGLFLLALSMGIKARHHFINDQPAIIFNQQVSVKSEPGTGNSELFVLHEGTKVQVVNQENQWLKIRIADGKTGWILKDKVKLLKD